MVRRFFQCAAVLLAAGCLPAGVRKTPAGLEYRVTGRLLVFETHCGTPPTPPRPRAGTIHLHQDGQVGSGVPSEPLLAVPTSRAGAFEVFLPPGTYCLGADAGLCERPLIVEAEPQTLDVVHGVHPDRPCTDP